jgi:predicted  nucleic acid-binding Zn-ribbon protein
MPKDGDAVARELKAVMTAWNGGVEHGRVSRLSQRIAVSTGEEEQAVARRIYRGVEGQPSWELVVLIVRHCAREDAGPRWLELTLERLAGIWYACRGAAPPGYIGHITGPDGHTVRPPITSLNEAADLPTKAAVLEQDLRTALVKQESLVDELTRVRNSATYFDDVAQQIHGMLNVMRTDTEELRSVTRQQIRPLREQVEFLNNRVHVLQQDVQQAEQRAAQLNVENGRLEDARRRTQNELEVARADHSRLSTALDEARRELGAATRELDDVRRDLERVTEASNASAPPAAHRWFESAETWRDPLAADAAPPVIDGG